MAELKTLLERLRRGEMPALDVNEVDALVGWLLGKGDDIAELPKPEHDPVLQQMVFYRLDATIFSGGELRLAAAGLGPEEPADLRKTRFRRLAGAFHPDRHPDLADWLTERSQAVLRAYGRFKHGDDPIAAVQSAAPPYPSYPPPRPPRRGPFRKTRIQLRAAADSLRRRFGNDRFLPHKLIGGLALLAMLPVLNLLLVPEPGRFDKPAVERDWGRSGPFAGNDIERNRSAAGKQASAESESTSGATSNGGSAGGAASYSDAGLEAIEVESAGGEKTGDQETRAEAIEVEGAEVDGADSPDSALLAAVRDAMRLGESEYGDVPSVDEQLALMGLDSDTERLYRRIRDQAGAQPGAVAAAPSRNRPSNQSAVQSPAESPAESPSESPAESPTQSPAQSPAQSVPTQPSAAAEVSTVEPHSTASAEGSALARTADTERPSDVDTDSIGTAEVAPIAAPPQPRLADSELKLGLLDTHSAGKLLRGFASDIEAGNLIALLTRFDRQARHGSLRGTEAIARHYQLLFEQASPRRAVLKVVRVERDGDRWQVETEFRIEGLHGEQLVSAQDGRAAFTLAGEPLRIQRLEF